MVPLSHFRILRVSQRLVKVFLLFFEEFFDTLERNNISLYIAYMHNTLTHLLPGAGNTIILG